MAQKRGISSELMHCYIVSNAKEFIHVNSTSDWNISVHMTLCVKWLKCVRMLSSDFHAVK